MLHIAHLDLERGWRGGQRQVNYLIRGLAANHGLRQTLICRHGSPYCDRIQDLPNVVVESVAGRVAAMARLFAIRPDIAHAHTGNTIPLAVCSPGAAVVTRRLDLAPRSFFLRRADVVVAISSSVRASLVRAGVSEQRIVDIPSAVAFPEETDAAATDASLLRELGIPAGTPVILAIGAMVDQKDPLTAVAALKELPNAHLVWVGDGDLRAEALDLADKLGVAQRLHSPGFDPHPERWFTIADVFVLPSVHEGLGTVYLDAFMHQVPVVGTNIAGTDDILRDGVTALRVPVQNPARLAGAIQTLLQQPELAARLVREARRHAENFTIERMTDAYHAAYDRIGLRETKRI